MVDPLADVIVVDLGGLPPIERMSDQRVKVLVVDDHVFFRRGLRELLMERGCEVIGEAGNGAAAVRLATELHPDVVVMDLQMPGLDGVEATKQIVAGDSGARIVVLTISASDEDVLAAISAGAAGYVLKDADVDEIAAGVQAAAAGNGAISPGVTRAVLGHVRATPAPDEVAVFPGLTDRELEVLRLLAQGYDNGEIAEALIVSLSTVKNHIGSLFEKLGVQNRVQAAVIAARHGLV